MRIATTDYGAAIVLASLASFLADQAPAIRIEAVPWGPDTFTELEAGRLGMALYADGDLPPGFHAHDLFIETYSCLMRQGHPILAARAADGTIAIEEFARFSRAVMLFPDDRRMIADDVLERLGVALETPPAFATP